MDNRGRTPIYLCAYPKSGSTWLARLLADVLDCPAGGSHPKEDRNELASEGWVRPEPYVVRKGHYRIVESKTVNPGAHQLNSALIGDAFVINMVRDPRDIAVSAAAYHRDKSLEDVIKGMVEGTLYGLPPWATYVHQWRNVMNDRDMLDLPFTFVRYEDLLQDTEKEVIRILKGFNYSSSRLNVAVKRQSFANRRGSIERNNKMNPAKRKHNLRLMRRGIAGDWKKHFNTKQLQWTMKHWAYEMEFFGYEC